MFYDVINNSDTVKAAVQKTTEAVATGGKSLGEVTFDPSLIGSQGVVVSIIGYVIVFIALMLLFFMIAQMSKAINYTVKKKLKSQGKDDASDEEFTLTGEINAAISMAIYLHYQEAHDIENTVLTIEKVQRRYSPWSSKLHGLRRYPTKR
ncbi:MAG: OadG family protein [Melioribacteraceae bacterium]|nr:OadG family protein [Melioribacteraceae bacterium]